VEPFVDIAVQPADTFSYTLNYRFLK
jgi:hypothetical protein